MNRNPRFLNSIVWLSVLLLTAASGFAQTTWYVDDDAPNDPGPDNSAVSDPLEDGSAEHPFDAIQEGVDAAEDGDTVSVARGLYDDAGNTDIILHGKGISVVGSQGDGVCRIVCDPGEVAFRVGSSAGRWIAISRFEIYHGGDDGYDGDGAIDCDEADLVIADCEFRSSDGPSIRAENSNVNVNRCSFNNCDAEQISCYDSVVAVTSCEIWRNHGSPIDSVRSYVRIDQCDITENDVLGAWSDLLSFYDSDVELTSCRIESNVGGECGGMYIKYGSALLMDTEISHNVTLYQNGDAAGISCHEAVLDVINCRIEHNHGAWEGGAISSQSGDCTFVNTLITKNDCMHTGGAGYFSRNPRLSFVNCTIADNESEYEAGGVYCYRTIAASFENCVFWNNRGGDTNQISLKCWDSLPSAQRVAFCDIEGGREGVLIDEESALIWGPGNLDVDPLFMDAAIDNYRLYPLSPCIDAGCNCAVSEDFADLDCDGDTREYVPYDLDGVGRFSDNPYVSDTGSGLPPVSDLGAYECNISSALPPVLGDLDGDRLVTLADLAIFLSNYGRTDFADGADGDMDCDGDVDLNDLARLLARYMPGI